MGCSARDFILDAVAAAAAGKTEAASAAAGVGVTLRGQRRERWVPPRLRWPWARVAVEAEADTRPLGSST
jgi:hypothetical protein